MTKKLSESDKQRVEHAVAELESRTAAELAVVVAHRSHDYAAYPFLWAAGLALLAGGIRAVAAPAALGTDVILIEGSVFAIVYLVLHLSPIGIALVPKAVKRGHAHRLARSEFSAIVDQRTDDRLGMLLFVSLAERHVEILVDRGIRAKIPRETWQTVMDHFRSVARRSSIGDGVLAVVDDCAALLERHFPPTPGTRNEIPNRITEI